MKAAFAVIAVLCLLLCGCQAFMEGEYQWQASHPVDRVPEADEKVSADTYPKLLQALKDLVHAGSAQGTVFVDRYDAKVLQADVQKAIRQLQKEDPIAAYAVQEIKCDAGTAGSRAALAVSITYIHDQTEIRRIRRVADNEKAWAEIQKTLVVGDASLVLFVDAYDPENADFEQMTGNFFLQMPQSLMELPQMVVSVYPEDGASRVVELKFIYQTGRDSLKSMQDFVARVFSSADLYVSQDAPEGEKLSQLYSFLMNRFDYKMGTSITPTYHLLCYGIGDSRAFASVYAAMCRQAGLDARVVTGTRDGEPWHWNIVQNDGVYYHVDLLRSSSLEDFQLWTDEQMEGYVWDFSLYPACGATENEEILE